MSVNFGLIKKPSKDRRLGEQAQPRRAEGEMMFVKGKGYGFAKGAEAARAAPAEGVSLAAISGGTKALFLT